MSKGLFTRYAAKEVGISLITLQRWIATGKVAPPDFRIIDGRATRVWNKEDIARLRDVKKVVYCRGRGRKKRARKRR